MNEAFLKIIFLFGYYWYVVKIDFYMQILYLATLLVSLLCSNNFLVDHLTVSWWTGMEL